MSRTIQISEIAKLNANNLKKSDTVKKIRYLDTGSITRDRIDHFQVIDLSFDKLPSRAKRKVCKQSIIYSTVRPNQEHYGYFENPSDNIVVSTGFTTIDVIDDGVDSKYLYYLLTQPSITSYLQTLAESAVTSYPSITAEDIGNLQFSIVELKEQKKISQFLTDIDSKIALNNRINEQLEAMAKLLYDYWFVQFDFPDANGRPYKSSGGKMVYNDQLKREIPEGWGVEKLGEIVDLKNGINYDKEEFGDTETKIVNVRNVSASSIFISSYDLDSLTLSSSKVTNYLASENTILVTRSGVPGATRLMPKHEENIIYSGFIIGATVKKTINKYLVFYNLKNLESSIMNQSAGTIMKNISQSTLTEMKIIVPDDRTIKFFNRQVDSIFKKIISINHQNQELAKMRDWLLPLLMNGQVTVS